jgi:hypothetical protein
MNFGSVVIKALLALAVLFLLSLAGALSFPAFSVITGGTGVGLTGFLLFILALVLFSLIGNLLAKGIRGMKKSAEALLMGFVSAFAMGGILLILSVLNVPYTVQVHLNWTGTSWYSPFLTLVFIGIPLMFVFLLGD